MHTESCVTVDLTTARPPGTTRWRHRRTNTDLRALVILGALAGVLALAGYAGSTYVAHLLLAGAR